MIDLMSDSALKQIASFIKKNQGRLEYQEKIFTILEGNLQSLLEDKMLVDLGAKSYSSAKTRMAPINIFRKIVNKLTRIYNQTVIRTVEGGNDSDVQLLKWYEETLGVNRKFSKHNFNFNAYLYALLQIGLGEKENPLSNIREPFIRSIPNHQFLIMNTSPTDPTEADIIITCMGSRDTADGKESIYWVYSDYQFVIINQGGKILTDLMADYEMDGVNPYDALPFTYANASQDCAMPSIQTDNLEMSLLIPLLLTDLNYAVKFQAFSVFVGIDIDDKSIEFSPNSILSFNSKPDGLSPSFTAIKPTIDIAETLSLASSEMSLWLSSKGIRPGTIGQVGADQFASGISKMIDESDTYEAIKEQIVIYTEFEKEFWETLLFDIHPKWVAQGVVANTTLFSAGAQVITKFTQPVPLQSRGELVKDLESEVAAGFISVKKAIQMLNPELDESQVDSLIAEISADKPIITGATFNGSQSGNAANAQNP